jgi:hypothetical protein
MTNEELVLTALRKIIKGTKYENKVYLAGGCERYKFINKI